MNVDYITIHPTPRSLLREPGTDPPSPAFVIEWGRDLHPTSLEIELVTEPIAFANQSIERCVVSLRARNDTGVTWELPSSVWQRLCCSERIYYRASARVPSGHVMRSDGRYTPDGLPFLHGRLSGGFYVPSCGLPEMPALRVSKGVLCRAGSDAPFLLRGVNVSGLNHARYFHGPSDRWRDAAGITPELLDRLCAMHVNLVRLPLNQDWLLMGYHESELPEYHQGLLTEYIRYLEDVDRIIAWAADRGMYVMLSLHTLRLFEPPKNSSGDRCDADGESLSTRIRRESMKQPYNAHLPDERSWLFWSVLAQRYRGCSAVLFDVFNEPHEVQKNAEGSSEYRGVRPPFSAIEKRLRPNEYLAWWAAEWKRWAVGLESTIHMLHPGALVFVSGFGGPNWGSSLEGMNACNFSGNPNVVLSVHWYWSEALGPDTWRRYLGLDRPVHHPVFVTEWGIETPEAVTQEQATDNPSAGYRGHWGGRPMPSYDTLRRWGEEVGTFFGQMASHRRTPPDSNFAGFAAWSTGDKPRMFKREGVGSGPYLPGFPLTDYGNIVQVILERLADTETA